MKKLISFLVVLSSIFSFAVFGGCDNQKPNDGDNSKTEAEERDYYTNHSQIFTLEEAYTEGFLSRDVIMHISYYMTGAVYEVPADCENISDTDNWIEVDFTPEQPRPELDFQTGYDIKSSYFFNNPKGFYDGDGNLKYGKDMLKVYYYGCYNGYYVACIDFDLWQYGAAIFPVRVGNIVWQQSAPSITVFGFNL